MPDDRARADRPRSQDTTPPALYCLCEQMQPFSCHCQHRSRPGRQLHGSVRHLQQLSAIFQIAPRRQSICLRALSAPASAPLEAAAEDGNGYSPPSVVSALLAVLEPEVLKSEVPHSRQDVYPLEGKLSATQTDLQQESRPKQPQQKARGRGRPRKIQVHARPRGMNFLDTGYILLSDRTMQRPGIVRYHTIEAGAVKLVLF